MENLDLIILSSVVSILFIVFIVGIYQAIKDADENDYKYAKEGGPRVWLFNTMAKLFEDERVTKKEKKVIYKAMYRTISDMESDGIYFPDTVKEKLKEYREELHCEYSGLPSVMSYDTKKVEKKENEEFLIGHS
jgi:hypothetical protein